MSIVSFLLLQILIQQLKVFFIFLGITKTFTIKTLPLTLQGAFMDVEELFPTLLTGMTTTRYLV